MSAGRVRTRKDAGLRRVPQRADRPQTVRYANARFVGARGLFEPERPRPGARRWPTTRWSFDAARLGLRHDWGPQYDPGGFPECGERAQGRVPSAPADLEELAATGPRLDRRSQSLRGEVAADPVASPPEERLSPRKGGTGQPATVPPSNGRSG